MNVKLKGNQTRENLIFSVKQLTDAYEYEMGDDIFYYIQDVNIATAQDRHKDLVEALNGLEGAIATQETNDLKKHVYRLLGQVDMEKEVI